MRELKFRAWNEMFKKFGLSDNTPLMINLEGKISANSDNWRIYQKECNQLIIYQYTGLKDKNGKEIYEGDIIKNNLYTNSGESLGNLWEIKFGEHLPYEDYNSMVVIGFYGESLTNKETYNLICIPRNIISKTNKVGIEIIGNIHENPELLETK